MSALPDEISQVDQELRHRGSLSRIDAGDRYSEADFDRFIVAQIGSISGALRSAGLIGPTSKLRIVGQQVNRMDVLAVEVAGEDLRRLVVIETKLFKNPEAHRSVLAQLLDYSN